MKELLRQYAAYNVWANQKLLDLILSLPDELQTRDLVSSFSSLYKTALHIHDAESTWWQRVKMQERISIPSENLKGNMRELAAALVNQSKQWEEWIKTPPNSPSSTFVIIRTQKENSSSNPCFKWCCMSSTTELITADKW